MKPYFKIILVTLFSIALFQCKTPKKCCEKEAVKTEEHYRAFADALDVPILANITEFGQTPLYTKEQLSEVGVEIVLYPLSAFRAMNKAAENVCQP